MLMLAKCRSPILTWTGCERAALEASSGAPTCLGRLSFPYFIVNHANNESDNGSPKENSTDNFSTAVHYESLRETLQQIDIIHTLVELYPDTLQIARSSAEVCEAHASGRIASFIGVEGLHQIANSASVLRNFHRLGVRYVTLTHDSNNLYADSAVSTDG